MLGALTRVTAAQKTSLQGVEQVLWMWGSDGQPNVLGCSHMPTTVEIARCCNGEVPAFLTGHLRDTLGTVLCRAVDPGCAPHELLSKLLVSPLITPIVVPYIIPYITPFKEFRLQLT